MTVKTIATGNLATTAKMCFRMISLNDACREIWVHFAHAQSWSWSAVPELIHPAEKVSSGSVSCTWNHTNMLSKYTAWYIPVQAVLGLCTCPCRCAHGCWTWNSTTLGNQGDDPFYGFQEFQNFPLIFPTFLVHFRHLSPSIFFFYVHCSSNCPVSHNYLCFTPRHARIFYWQIHVPTRQQYANN